MSRYPGDDIVDLMGLDHYEFLAPDGAEASGKRFAEELQRSLSILQALGIGHNKLICLSETGLESIPDLEWWTKVLYPAIADYPIAYALTWRNAHDQATHFYAPWEGFEGAADFKAFSELEDIKFLD